MPSGIRGNRLKLHLRQGDVGQCAAGLVVEVVVRLHVSSRTSYAYRRRPAGGSGRARANRLRVVVDRGLRDLDAAPLQGPP